MDEDIVEARAGIACATQGLERLLHHPVPASVDHTTPPLESLEPDGT